MVSEALWIAIAVIAVLLLAALVVGLVRYRRRRISLTSPDTATPVDRSGGYTASSGITFAQSAPLSPSNASIPAGCLPSAMMPPFRATRRNARLQTLQLPEPVAEQQAPAEVEAPSPAEVDVGAIAPPEGRLDRLRGRLAKSQNTLGRSMLGLLGGGDLDEDSWQDVEDTLLIADLGPVVTESVVSALRSRMASSNVRTETDARAVCAMS